MSKLKTMILTVSMIAIVSLSVTAQTPTAPAQAPMRVSAAEQDKKVTKRVNPLYPKEAFAAKLTAEITLETTIGADGKVENVRPVNSTADPTLIKAAVDAVKQWVYKPTKVDGMAVAVMTFVKINFKVGE